MALDFIIVIGRVIVILKLSGINIGAVDGPFINRLIILKSA